VLCCKMIFILILLRRKKKLINIFNLYIIMIRPRKVSIYLPRMKGSFLSQSNITVQHNSWFSFAINVVVVEKRRMLGTTKNPCCFGCWDLVSGWIDYKERSREHNRIECTTATTTAIIIDPFMHQNDAPSREARIALVKTGSNKNN
jgi:hypothetical protein